MATCTPTWGSHRTEMILKHNRKHGLVKAHQIIFELFNTNWVNQMFTQYNVYRLIEQSRNLKLYSKISLCIFVKQFNIFLSFKISNIII